MNDQHKRETNTSNVDEILAQLGGSAVLLPIPTGAKGPKLKGWNKLKANDMTQPEHRARVEKAGNIGVLLGNSSGGLCTIDIDDDADVEPFLELNPKLAATLRTKGSRGCNFWIRVSGEFPALTKLKKADESDWGEWRADGGQTVIRGVHPSGVHYRVLESGPPVELCFDEINWPGDLKLPWKASVDTPGEEPFDPTLSKLLDDYGEPFFTGPKGALVGLNERFWAGAFTEENRVLFEPDESRIYSYAPDTGLWTPLSQENQRERLAKRIFDGMREAGHTRGEKLLTKGRLDNIVGALKGISEKRGVFLRKPPMIHIANGVVRFTDERDMIFDSPKPEDYSRNRSPISYEPEADCPRFLDELIRPALSEQDAELLQRWAGLALFGNNLPQRLLLLEGTAGGGKSTLATIVQSLVGRANTCQLRTDCLTERFELFRFIGKTLLIAPDVPGNFLCSKGAPVIKALVGGDPITAEGKGLNGGFELVGNFNALVTCNSRLRVRLDGDVAAWRRRLLIIRYENPPPAKRIPDFAGQLLKEEGSGILRWGLAGFAKLLVEFESHGDFALTSEQEGRVESLLAESDSARVFLTEKVEKSSGSDVTSEELTEAYAEFCSDMGWNPLPITIFERQIPDLMLEVFQSNKSQSIKRDEKSKRGYRNVNLKGAGGKA